MSSAADTSPPAATPTSGPSRSRLALTAGIAVLVLFAVEALARLAVSAAATPHSYEVPRNPHFRRGWQAYTEPRLRPEGTRLVIVISNSQGFLREHPDGALAWPGLVESRIAGKGRGADVIVANWSVAGGQGPEMIVLAARAAQHRPDAVLLVTSGGNFSPLWARQPLSYWLSDATGLAYLPEVRERLSEDFLERSSADDPLVWMAARTGIGRARKRFFEKRDEAWSWRAEAPSRLGDIVERTLDQRGEGFTLGVGAKSKTAEARKPATDPQRDSTREAAIAAQLDELVRTVQGTSPETRLLVVSMPFARPEQPGVAWEAAQRFHSIAARALDSRAGVTVVDAIDAVPPQHFVRATHLEPSGHVRFAEWLLPHLERVLAEHDRAG